MHSGGGSSNVVSVAPATPIIKHMIGIAALVLEGRERSTSATSTPLDPLSKPKESLVGVSAMNSGRLIPVAASSSSTGTSTALYAPAEATPVAAALATTHSSSTTAIVSTSNWARAQNNRLAHIYRLKNKLLMETVATQGGGGGGENVATVDYDQMAGCGGVYLDDGGGGIFDPMQHLTAPRICRLRTPRSLINHQLMMQERQTSSSSSSCSSSSGSAASPALGRRNSRTSPVPTVIMAGGGVGGRRIHCDDFLRTIGLIKGGGGGGATVPPQVGKGPIVVVGDEVESHFCDEVVSAECFRWQQFLRKIETLLCRGSSICIEVSLGPEAHPLLLEQWIIQRVERPSQPAMTLQSLCSAIRSQLHFSQISAWSDVLEQQYTDYAFYQENILKNPRITMHRHTSRPALDLIYRVKCATQKGTFERPPVVHNFPNVLLDAATGLAVSLRSLPRLERIPRLNVENKKSDMMEVTVVEAQIFPSPMGGGGITGGSAGGGGGGVGGSSSTVCCQEKGKHLCSSSHQREGGGGGGSSGSGTSTTTTSSSGGGGLSHREKQLLKYKRRLQKRDKGGKEEGNCSLIDANASSVSVTSINDLRLPPLYTEEDAVHEKEAVEVEERHLVPSQDAATQTDVQLSIDDELVEMEMDVEDEEGEMEMDVDLLPLSTVPCRKCDKQMRLLCCSQGCESAATLSSGRQRLQRLRDKYRNAMVAKRATTNNGQGGRVFYKIPKRFLWSGTMKVNALNANAVMVKGEEQVIEGGREGENNQNDDAAIDGKKHQEDGNQDESNNNVATVVNRNLNVGAAVKADEVPPRKKVTEFSSLCDFTREQEDKQMVTMAASPAVVVVVPKGTMMIQEKEKQMEEEKQMPKRQKEAYQTPTNGIHLLGGEKPPVILDQKNKRKEEKERNFNSMKLCKLDHQEAAVSLKAADPHSTTSSPSLGISSMAVHCVKNLTTIFTNATEAAAAALVKPPTPQVMLKRLNLYAQATQEAATAAASEASNGGGQGNVFNFDLAAVARQQEVEEEKENKRATTVITPVRHFGGIKKSFSTPSAIVTNEEQLDGGGGAGGSGSSSKTPNSLSPRFLKSACAYNKKQKRRSRHLSDRSSERSSVCSDELSLSDDEMLLLTPNGSNVITSPGALNGRGRGKGASLFKSAFGHGPLLGSIEESLLQRRLTPKYLVSGFRVLLGASGSFCPEQLTIPAKTFFYELSGQSQTTPYMSEVRLPRKGYTVPRRGTVQVTLLNPLGTFVHMFVVAYDFGEMPPMATTFIRQRSLMVEDGEHKQKEATTTTGGGMKATTGGGRDAQMRLLRYVIHLRFQTTRSGRLMLHSDIRMLINRRTDHDTAAAHAKGAMESPNELKTITVMPEGPRLSERIDKV